MTVTALRFPAIEIPTLVAPISHIVPMGPKKEVVRIDTRRVIAGVEHAYTCRDSYMNLRPHPAVSLPIATPNPKVAIVVRRRTRSSALPRHTRGIRHQRMR